MEARKLTKALCSGSGLPWRAVRLSVNERTQTKAALRFRWALFKPTLDDQCLSWAERQRPPHAELLGTLKTFLLENKEGLHCLVFSVINVCFPWGRFFLNYFQSQGSFSIGNEVYYRELYLHTAVSIPAYQKEQKQPHWKKIPKWFWLKSIALCSSRR